MKTLLLSLTGLMTIAASFLLVAWAVGQAFNGYDTEDLGYFD